VAKDLAHIARQLSRVTESFLHYRVGQGRDSNSAWFLVQSKFGWRTRNARNLKHGRVRVPPEGRLLSMYRIFWRQ